MCLLALYFRMHPAAEIILAAQREEAFARRSLPPAVQPGNPAVLCGTDVLAGGTWLGVNTLGLVVAVTNRDDAPPADHAESRGVLCQRLLQTTSARAARDQAITAFQTRPYAGANILCADRHEAYIVSHGSQLVLHRVPPGRHLLGNGDPNDPGDVRLRHAESSLPLQPAESVSATIDTLAGCMQQPAIADTRASLVVRAGDRGTVSSTLLAIGPAPQETIYRYAPGPPDQTDYDDYSPALQTLLFSRGMPT